MPDVFGGLDKLCTLELSYTSVVTLPPSMHLDNLSSVAWTHVDGIMFPRGFGKHPDLRLILQRSTCSAGELTWFEENLSHACRYPPRLMQT